MKRFWILTLASFLAILLGVMAWKIAGAQDHMLNSDFFTFWLGGRMISLGQDPYDPTLWKAGHDLAGSTWLENPIYCYPLPLAYLTFLIGVMPITFAGPVWLFLSACSILLAILILQSRRWDGLKWNQLFPVILGLAFFRPVLTTIRNGQLGSFFLIILVAALLFAEKKKWIIVGILTALLYLKPTLGLPILGLFFIWFFRNNGRKGILVNVLAAVSVLVVSLIHLPGWLSSFFSVGLNKGSDVFMRTPTIWGVSAGICGLNSSCAQFTGAIITILVAVGAVILYWKFSTKMNIWLAGSIAVLIALLITPYLWAYDQVLLILPILYVTNALTRTKTPYIIVSLLPILFTMISLLLLYMATLNGHDVGSILLTLITAGALIWIEIRMRKQENGPITS